MQVNSRAPGQFSRTHITVQNNPGKRGRESRPLLTDADKTACGQGQETPKTEPGPWEKSFLSQSPPPPALRHSCHTRPPFTLPHTPFFPFLPCHPTFTPPFPSPPFLSPPESPLAASLLLLSPPALTCTPLARYLHPRPHLPRNRKAIAPNSPKNKPFCSSGPGPESPGVVFRKLPKKKRTTPTNVHKCQGTAAAVSGGSLSDSGLTPGTLGLPQALPAASRTALQGLNRLLGRNR